MVAGISVSRQSAWLLCIFCIVQCTTTRSSTGTSNPPTCYLGRTVTSRSQTLVWATSLRGQTPSCRARRGRRPSWPPKWWPNMSRASAERWDKTCSGGKLVNRQCNHWSTYVLGVTYLICLCLIVRNVFQPSAVSFSVMTGPENYWNSICFPGVRRVGDGSHTVLFCLWEGKKVHSKMHVE